MVETLSFKVSLEAEKLKQIVSATSAVSAEATLKFSSNEGLKCDCLDASKIALMSLLFKPENFKVFQCPQNIDLTISIQDLNKRLQNIKKEDVIDIELTTEQWIKMTKKGGYTTTFVLKTLEPSEESRPMPTIRYNTKAKIAYYSLNSALKDTAIVSDEVTLKTTENSFVIESKGVMGDAIPEFKRGDEPLIELLSIANTEGIYSLIFLKDILENCSGISDVVILEFGSGMPLHIIFPVLFGKLEYLLAPRLRQP